DRPLPDTQRLPQCRHRHPDQSGYAYQTLIEPFVLNVGDAVMGSPVRTWGPTMGGSGPILVVRMFGV
ncbi:MAG: hypothetical protein ACLPTZ_07065, partial [Beijerinckiaceae bacterium]